MSIKPLVSVCIPAYNNADYILETINCILNQTYENIELIIVDDNSTDDTLAVIEGISDKRVKVFHNDKNLGMAGNWNRCLELCTGKYIKLICADDLIHKNLIANEVKLLEQYPEVNLVSSDTQFVDLNGKSAGYYRRYKAKGIIDGKTASKYSVFTRDYLGAPLANTFRKSVYEELGGFDESFVYIIDYDFFMKIYNYGKVYILHKPWNYFRIRNDSNTGQVMGGGKEEAYINEHRRLVEKHAEELGLTAGQIKLSVSMRKFMSFLGNIYLKIFVPKE